MDAQIAGAFERHRKAQIIAKESKDAFEEELKAALKDKRLSPADAKELSRSLGKE